MTLIITDADVTRLFSMRDCVEAMRVAFADFSDHVAVNRPRMRYLARHPDPECRYMANVHVGAVPSSGVAVVRAGSQIMRPASATNQRRTYENPKGFNWGVVILYSIETAEPLAFMHEFALSGMRVGATTGLAVDLLTPPNAGTLGLFGTGKQARSALEAIETVRPIRRVNVFSPNVEHRDNFALDMAHQGLEVVAVDSPKKVVRDADVICCATNAMGPVFDGDWLENGQFVISIANSDVTNKRSEVDQRVYERATGIIVNDWESVVDNDQSELLDPIAAGVIERAQVHELGDIVTGRAKLMHDPLHVTYFKNNSGLAIQFAAAGGIIYKKALAEGVCRSIPTEWLGSDLSAYYEAGFRPSP